MKSILVIDTPKNCEECRLTYVHTRKDTFCCCLTDKEIECRNDKENRDVDCPLRPLPNRWIPQVNGLSIDQQIRNIDFASGWNTCLKKITGETE